MLAGELLDFIYDGGCIERYGSYSLSKKTALLLLSASEAENVNLLEHHSRLTTALWNDGGLEEEYWGKERISEINESLKWAEIYPEAFSEIDLKQIQTEIAKQQRELEYQNSYEFRRLQASLFTSRQDIRRKVFKAKGRECAHCGKTRNLTLDHIIPVKHGGEDTIENLQVLCRSCNSRKGSSV